MLRLAIVTTLAFLSTTAGASAACPRAPRDTVVDTGRVVVWGESDIVIGCLRSTGRRTVIHDDFDATVGRLRAAGAIVAFGVEYHDRELSRFYLGRVEVWDLRSRRRVRRHLVEHIPSGYEPRMRDLEVRATGSAAYTIASHDPTEVWLLSRTRRRRLDRGAGIDPVSLRRDGARVRWAHDGSQRSARMP